MKKAKTPIQAKTFKIQFSKSILFLAVAVYVLCVAGVAVSVWRIMQFGVKEFLDVIKYPFLIAVCIFCIVLVTCVLLKSQYVVDERFLTTQYGFIKSKFPVKNITEITQDTDCKKLTVKFGEEYMVITVNSPWNEEFVRALLAVNPDIDYGFTLTEVPTGNDKQEK